jgi:hypothetical protein
LRPEWTNKLGPSSGSSVRPESNQPEKLALQYMERKIPITSKEINKLVSSQQVSITEEELAKLLSLPAVEFNLPIENQTYASFAGLVGKPKSRGRYVGVYIFTHTPVPPPVGKRQKVCGVI